MPYSLALRCPDGRSQHENPPDDNGKAKRPFNHVFTRMAYLLREKTYLFQGLHQRSRFPHGGTGEFCKSDQLLGVK